MSFRSTPLFAGDLYDTALRLAQEDVLKPSAAQEGAPSNNWQQMLALGWQGVLVAEDDGGVGASIQDLSAIVEAVARHGNDAPLVDRCAAAPSPATDTRARSINHKAGDSGWHGPCPRAGGVAGVRDAVSHNACAAYEFNNVLLKCR